MRNTYNNRIILFLFIVFIFTKCNLSFSQSKHSVTSGSWTLTTTWGGPIPTATDNVTITAGTTVTLASDITCESLNIEAGATLDNANFTSTIVFSALGTFNGSSPEMAEYLVNGTHAGTGNIILDISTSGSNYNEIAGTGTISNTSQIRLFTGGNGGGVEFGAGFPCDLKLNCDLNLATPMSSGSFANHGKLHLLGSKNMYCPSSISTFTNRPTGTIILDNGSVFQDQSNSNILNRGYFEIKTGNLYIGGANNRFDNRDSLIVGGSVLGLNGVSCGFINYNNAKVKVAGEFFPPTDDGYLICAGYGTGVNALEPNTVIYNGSGSQLVKVPKDNAFIGYEIDSTYSTVIFTNAGTKTLRGNIFVNDSLIINENAVLSTSASPTYNITMNGTAIWKDSSNNTHPFLENISTVSFVQTGMQSIIYSGGGSNETFYNLNINKASSDLLVTQYGSVAVSNQLTLQQGGLSINSSTLTITTSTTAITRSTGFIKSETTPTTNYSFVNWKIGNGVGNYQFPFGKSGDINDYIPVTFNITNAGDNAGSIAIATYSTTVNNLPLPTGVINLERNGVDKSLNTVDRFWIINSNYATNPTATFILTATVAELGGITNPRAQRWNTTTNLWEFPLPNQTYSITPTSVSVSVPNFNMISSPWTISDNNHLLSAKPLVSHSPNATICLGTSVTLTASGVNAVYYSWSPIASLNTLSFTAVTTPTLSSTLYHFGNELGITSVIATPSVTTTYTLIISNNSGLDTSYITVYVPEAIVAIMLTSNASICSGNDFQILSKTTISTPAHYSWSPTTSLNNATVFDPIASPQQSITYTLTISDDWNCFNTTTLLIHVEVQPTLVVSPPITICNGSSTLLTANVSGGILSWSNTSATTDTIVQPNATVIYGVFAENSYCIGKQLIQVTVIPLPTVSSENNPFMCVGATTGATLTGAGSSGTYVWTPNTYLGNPNSITTNANPPQIGIYHYTLTVTESHGCSNYDGVILTVDTTLQANAGSDLTICSGITTSLNATITAGSSIVWNPSIGLTSNTISTPTLNFSTLQLLNYTITVSAPGCNDTSDYVTINVLQSPQLITSNVSICIGGVTPTLSVNGADVCVWYPIQDTTFTLSPLLQVTTSYTIIGINNNGCTDTTQINVNVNQLPNVDAGSNITASTSLKLNLQGSGASTYLWTPASNLDQNDIPNPEIKTRITQKYNLIGTDQNGCVNTDSVYIKYIVCDEIFVPEAFSPNDDNQNDNLEIIVEDSQCIQTLNFQIYDRWGTMVFETNDPTVKWDGKYHNQELTDAVFVFRIDIKNVDGMELTQKGNVSLIR